jgi:hypothetical protein
MVDDHDYGIYLILNSIQGPGVLLGLFDLYLIFVTDKFKVSY